MFLLSRADVKNANYGFKATSNSTLEESRLKNITAYAIAQINGGYDASNGAWWWLRTPAPHAEDKTRADLVHNIKVNGILNNGTSDQTTGGVVPAMWIEL